MNDGTWRHVALTWKQANGQFALYINGVLTFATTIATGQSRASVGALALANDQDCVGGCFDVNQAFNGDMDDVRIYNRALSATEVRQLSQLGMNAPTIVIQPQGVAAPVGWFASLSVTAAGTSPLSYQWWKDGVKLAGRTTAALNISPISLGDAGYYSVVVTNAVGSATSKSARLAVPNDPAGGTTPPQLDPGQETPKTVEKDSLVFITHGWQNRLVNVIPPLSVPWLDEMRDTIAAEVTRAGKQNWQVASYQWTLYAWAYDPDTAIISGALLGTLKGKQLAAQGWKHIHLVGHSAGAAFVQAAAKAIKEASPTTIIHTTFLDPFAGLLLTGRDSYGAGSHWSDNYFSIDGTSPFTEGKLTYSYNADVTWLDPDRSTWQKWCATSGGGAMQPCGQVAQSSHAWPHEYYLRSVTNGFPTYSQYGYARSKEGGGWDERSGYVVGKDPVVVAGPPIDWISLSASREDLPFVLTELPRSTSGNVGVDARTLSLATATVVMSPRGGGPQPGGGSSAVPAWISMGVTVTNPANAVLFDARFSSADQAEGLLSVYWDTNQIGLADERVAGSGSQSYSMPLPFVEVGGVHLLGLRLDAYTTTNASVVITNVRTAWISAPKPSLAMGIATNTGLPVLTVNGIPGAAYSVEASTNLLDWATLGVFSSTNAAMYFADPASVTNMQRFYRAKPW